MRLQHSFEYAGLLGIAALMRVLPRPVALGVGACIGRLGWWLRIRRRLVLANLAQAFPDLAPAARHRIAARAARNFGRTVSEFVRFSGRDRRHVLDFVTVEGLDDLEQVSSAGRGAIVVTAHLGSWALYVTALAAHGIPSALLVGRQHNEKVDRFILDIPGKIVRFISKGRSAPRDVLRCLRDGCAVVMVADQDAGGQGTFAPFLGREASTLSLPGAIVSRHDTPLLVMAGHRTASGRHHVVLQRLSGADTDDARAVTVAFNRALGRAILAHPDQYFWYHRRWRDYAASRLPVHQSTASPRNPSSASTQPSDNDSGR